MRARLVAAALAGTLLVAACSSGSTPDPAPGEGAGNPSPTTTAAIASTTASPSVATTVASSVDAPAAEPAVSGDAKTAVAAVDPDNVLTAAVLVVSAGDVDAALASGLFSEEELTAALDAIEQGTLARYVRP